MKHKVVLSLFALATILLFVRLFTLDLDIQNDGTEFSFLVGCGSILTLCIFYYFYTRDPNEDAKKRDQVKKLSQSVVLRNKKRELREREKEVLIREKEIQIAQREKDLGIS